MSHIPALNVARDVYLGELFWIIVGLTDVLFQGIDPVDFIRCFRGNTTVNHTKVEDYLNRGVAIAVSFNNNDIPRRCGPKPDDDLRGPPPIAIVTEKPNPHVGHPRSTNGQPSYGKI